MQSSRSGNARRGGSRAGRGRSKENGTGRPKKTSSSPMTRATRKKQSPSNSKPSSHLMRSDIRATELELDLSNGHGNGSTHGRHESREYQAADFLPGSKWAENQQQHTSTRPVDDWGLEIDTSPPPRGAASTNRSPRTKPTKPTSTKQTRGRQLDRSPRAGGPTFRRVASVKASSSASSNSPSRSRSRKPPVPRQQPARGRTRTKKSPSNSKSNSSSPRPTAASRRAASRSRSPSKAAVSRRASGAPAGRTGTFSSPARRAKGATRASLRATPNMAADTSQRSLRRHQSQATVFSQATYLHPGISERT